MPTAVTEVLGGAVDEGPAVVVAPRHVAGATTMSGLRGGSTAMSDTSSVSSMDEEVELAFLCKLEKAHLITPILNTVNVKAKETLATVTLTKKGIKLTVEEAKAMQGNAFLQAELFEEYKLVENMLQFRIGLSALLDCLNVFGSNPAQPTRVSFLYKGYGHPLVLIMHTTIPNSDVTCATDVSLKTLETEGITNFNFRGSPLLNKVIMDSSCLKDAFNELDWSSSYVGITLSPEEPYFRLESEGELGSCRVDYPKDSKEVFESFECSQTQHERYRLGILQAPIRALGVSSKTQVRCNQRGLLSFQHMLHCDSHRCFVDFVVLPSEMEDSDEEMEFD